MKHIILSFSEDELLELARQLYMSGYFLNHFENYPTKEIAFNVEEKISTVGFRECNQEGYFEPGHPEETRYRLTQSQLEPLEPVVEAFKKAVMRDYLDGHLAVRDFEEKYGPIDNIDFKKHPLLFLELRNMEIEYNLEFMANGFKNLKLVRINRN